MNRDIGKGPFAVAILEPLADYRAVVMDVTGAPFCYVGKDDCHGRNIAAAKARATRIAEALNKVEGHTRRV